MFPGIEQSKAIDSRLDWRSEECRQRIVETTKRAKLSSKKTKRNHSDLKMNMFSFGGTPFHSLREVTRYCRDVLRRQTETEFLPGHYDFHVLEDIFKRVESYQHTNFAAIGFKHNGEKESFFYYKVPESDQIFPISYRLCLKEEPRLGTPEKMAFQNAVKFSLLNFKKMHPEKKASHEIIYHPLSFDKIWKQFLSEEKLTNKDILGSITTPLTGISKSFIHDADLKKKWITYHEKHKTFKWIPIEKGPQEPMVTKTKYDYDAEKVMEIYQEEKQLQPLLDPLKVRLEQELKYQHYWMKVPVCFVRLTPLGRNLLDDPDQSFNPDHWNVQNIFLEMLYFQGQSLAISRFPKPFHLRSKPVDSVIFIDRTKLCTLKTEEQVTFYVPVYFQTTYIIYCVILSLANLIQWNWLESQWHSEYREQLKLTRTLIRLMQVSQSLAQKKNVSPVTLATEQGLQQQLLFEVPSMQTLVEQ